MPHDFEIADNVAAERLRNEAINKTFRYFYSTDDKLFKKIAARHSYRRADKEFKQHILKIYEDFNSEDNPDALAEKFSGMYSQEGYNRFADELICLFKEGLHPIAERAEQLLQTADRFFKPKLYAFIKNLKDGISRCLAVKTDEDLFDVKNIKIPLTTENKLSDDELSVKEQGKKLRDDFEKILKDFTSEITDKITTGKTVAELKEHADCIVYTLKKFNEFYTELKREENILDFDDLQHFALKVLQDEQVLSAVKSKYKFIFVDEYQDVNGVQEKIIDLISQDNTFMVGDVKQSIYGFRGCRPDFFVEKFDKMSKTYGKTAHLNYSFRSASNVIKAVNDVFDFCMNVDSFGIDYKTTSRLVEGGIYPDGFRGRSQLHFLKKPKIVNTEKETPRTYNILDEINSSEKCASKISTLIAKIIGEETSKKIYDTKAECERFVCYKDIAVLSRKKDDELIMGIISGLKNHGIPVVSDASDDILSYPEIQMIQSVVKLIDCYYDEIALATVLKSPIGNFSDEDFLEIVKFGLSISEKKYCGFFDAFNISLEKSESPLHQKVAEFDEYFSSIRKLADFMPISDVLALIVREKSLEAFLFAQTDGESKVKRLRRFLSFCSSEGRPYTAKDVLKLMEDSKNGISFLPVDDADAVTVMTIHGSKGLEFPVVIVCGLEQGFGIRHESDEFLFDRDDGIAIKYYGDDRRKKETVWRKVFKKRMRVSVTREEMRILYVALTRATYSLHMVYEASEDLRQDNYDGAQKYIDCIPRSLPQTMYEYDDLDFEETKRGVRKVIVGKVDDELKSKIKESFTYTYPFASDTTLPLKISVTSAIENEEPVYRIFEEYDEPTDKDRGIIAHKFMEYADLNDSDVFGQAERLKASGILNADELSKIDLNRIRKVFETGVLTASKTAEIYREKSFLCNVPARRIMGVDTDAEVLMQGVIDLLILDGDRAKIIDYKYSKLDPESLKDKYRKQLDLYSFAVEKVFGVKVEEKIIVCVFSGDIVKID